MRAKNHNKLAILNFFQPLSNLSENCLLVTGITNLNRIHGKLFKLSRPQGQIIAVKNRNKSIILNFFSAIIELVRDWSFATYITHLGRIHEKLFEISFPQVNVNADTEL